MESFVVGTRTRNDLIDITPEVNRITQKNGVVNGLVTVFVPHTTAAVTINENADPSVKHDLLKGLSDIARPISLSTGMPREIRMHISRPVWWGLR